MRCYWSTDLVIIEIHHKPDQSSYPCAALTTSSYKRCLGSVETSTGTPEKVRTKASPRMKERTKVSPRLIHLGDVLDYLIHSSLVVNKNHLSDSISNPYVFVFLTGSQGLELI